MICRNNQPFYAPPARRVREEPEARLLFCSIWIKGGGLHFATLRIHYLHYHFMISTLLYFAADEAPQQGNPLMQMAPLLLIFVLFYFMLIRPQRRQQKEHQLKLAALKSGDEVIACGGLHGLVTNVADRTITLKIADNVKIKVERQSVVAILKKADEPEPAPVAEKTESSPAS